MDVADNAGPEAAEFEVDGGQEVLTGRGQVAGGRVDPAAPNLRAKIIHSFVSIFEGFE